jgi:hypothetical protein
MMHDPNLLSMQRICECLKAKSSCVYAQLGGFPSVFQTTWLVDTGRHDLLGDEESVMK